MKISQGNPFVQLIYANKKEGKEYTNESYSEKASPFQ
jgi:hypothetical protein